MSVLVICRVGDVSQAACGVAGRVAAIALALPVVHCDFTLLQRDTTLLGSTAEYDIKKVLKKSLKCTGTMPSCADPSRQ